MIEVADLSFRYSSDGADVVRGLTHRFETGSVTAITGPSGCGKSTLLYLVGLLLIPTGGTVSLDRQPVAHLTDGERARLRAARIGFVFQDAALDETRSVLANVHEGALYAGLDRAAVRQRATALLERFGVALPLRRKPGQVSGGQAQRVALCRALVKRPPVLLADEPTGNLDRDSAAVVWDALQGTAGDGATVIVVTHDPALAARADHVLEL